MILRNPFYFKEAHNVIQAGKRKKEFADPYTVTGAVTKGNIITKLSLLIMGLGNIAHRQIAKGLMFLVVEASGRTRLQPQAVKLSKTS